MSRVLQQFTNLYPLWTIGGSLAAFVYPGLFGWFVGTWIVWGLMAIMLAMGLTLSLADFRRLAAMPGPVALGVAAQYTIMPLSAWAIAYGMALDTHLAVGLILVACCPGGTASNLVTYLARADVALSVILTMVSTLLAVVMTPVLTKFWAGHLIPVDAWGMFLSTFQVVLLPVALGIFIHHRFPRVAASLGTVGPAVAVLVIAMIAGSIVAQNVDSIARQGVRLAAAAALLHTCGFVFGYWVARASGFSRLTGRTVSIEVGMQNSGLAAVLAKQHFAALPMVAAPAVFASIFHSILGSLCAAYWRTRPVDRREPEGASATADRRDIYYWKCDRPAAFHGICSDARTEASERAAAALLPHLRQRLGDDGLSLERSGAQGIHLTYLARGADATYFVRVDDGPEGDGYIEVETHLLEKVRGMGVPSPRVVLADASRAEVPCAYQVLEYVPHPDLNRWHKEGCLAWSEVASEIGRNVATWQAITPRGFGPFDLHELRQGGALTGLHASYEAYFLLNWERHLQFLCERDFLTRRDADRLAAIVREHGELLRLEQGCLVHKDLALWNLLGTPRSVEAVIDWEDAVSGDPTDDLSLLACFHSWRFVAATIEGYQTVRPLPSEFDSRFWIHLLRNMVVKSVIRVGAGYFDRTDDLFLIPRGDDGKSFEQLTRERLWLAYHGLRERQTIAQRVQHETEHA